MVLNRQLAILAKSKLSLNAVREKNNVEEGFFWKRKIRRDCYYGLIRKWVGL
jgi:hypothetical protein